MVTPSEYRDAVFRRSRFSTGRLSVDSRTSDDTTPASLTVAAPGAGSVVAPVWFRFVASCGPSNLIDDRCVYIERYAEGDTPGVSAPLSSAWTPLTPHGTVTALSLITGARHWEWESKAPLEVGAVSGATTENTQLHVRFDGKISAENQYIAVNYREIEVGA